MIVAVELLLTLVKAYLTTSLGVILLGFGGNRFTASAAEGYFTNVIRIGTRLLFFYAVLAVGMQLVVQWQAALLAACAPAPTSVSMIHSYYVPPSAMIVSVCTGTITLSQMFAYAALAVACLAFGAAQFDYVGSVLFVLGGAKDDLLPLCFELASDSVRYHPRSPEDAGTARALA